jgi:hypothetical protein
MKTWMLPFVFPVGMVVAVVFVVVFNPYEAIAAVVAGVVLIPVLWRVHFADRGDADDTNYWRIRRL